MLQTETYRTIFVVEIILFQMEQTPTPFNAQAHVRVSSSIHHYHYRLVCSRFSLDQVNISLHITHWVIIIRWLLRKLYVQTDTFVLLWHMTHEHDMRTINDVFCCGRCSWTNSGKGYQNRESETEMKRKKMIIIFTLNNWLARELLIGL